MQYRIVEIGEILNKTDLAVGTFNLIPADCVGSKLKKEDVTCLRPIESISQQSPIQYDVICKCDMDDLIKTTNSALKAGWKLHGPLVVVNEGPHPDPDSTGDTIYYYRELTKETP